MVLFFIVLVFEGMTAPIVFFFFFFGMVSPVLLSDVLVCQGAGLNCLDLWVIFIRKPTDGVLVCCHNLYCCYPYF
jgi:hypothetical protein